MSKELGSSGSEIRKYRSPCRGRPFRDLSVVPPEDVLAPQGEALANLIAEIANTHPVLQRKKNHKKNNR